MCDHALVSAADPGSPSLSAAGNWSQVPAGHGHNATRSRAGGSCVQVVYPAVMMVAGVAGNAIALALIRRAYPRRQSARKRPFLVLVGALVLTDLLGKLTTAPVVIASYSAGSMPVLDATGRLCDYFGFCMVAFGLCPLLFACAMAVERNVAVRRPYSYKRWVTTRLAVALAGAVWAAALGFSALPLVGLGRYALQWPKTWCFLSTAPPSSFADSAVALTFSLTGLSSLLVTTACNASTLTFVISSWRQHRRQKQQQLQLNQQQQQQKMQCGGPRCPGGPRSEAVLQLMGISAVLWACWGPLLVVMTVDLLWPPGLEGRSTSRCSEELVAVRLASLSQILDPWVYILLRRGALLRGNGSGARWGAERCGCCNRGHRVPTPEPAAPTEGVRLQAVPKPPESPGDPKPAAEGQAPCHEDEDSDELITLPGRLV